MGKRQEVLIFINFLFFSRAVLVKMEACTCRCTAQFIKFAFLSIIVATWATYVDS